MATELFGPMPKAMPKEKILDCKLFQAKPYLGCFPAQYGQQMMIFADHNGEEFSFRTFRQNRPKRIIVGEDLLLLSDFYCSQREKRLQDYSRLFLCFQLGLGDR